MFHAKIRETILDPGFMPVVQATLVRGQLCRSR